MMTKFDCLTERGLTDEKVVIDFLRKRFSKVEPSSKNDNILFDRDCWILGNEPKAVSIKSQRACLTTGNLSFQLYVGKKSTKVLGEYDKDLGLYLRWFKSDWFNGKVDYYIILVGFTIYQIVKDDLIQYLKENNWCCIKSLKKETKLLQYQRNHPHLNAKNGLVSLKKLLDSKVAKKLGVLPPQKIGN